MVDGYGKAKCWQRRREPGWERRLPPPQLHPLARTKSASEALFKSALADFEYWAALLAATRLDPSRPDAILPGSNGDATPDAGTEETREPSQTVEVSVAPGLAAAAAVNLDEAELTEATSRQPEEPSGITRQRGADRTVIPANSLFTDSRQFSWPAWQEAFRKDPETVPVVSRKARMRHSRKPRQPRPQEPDEGPPGSPGATWQQGLLALEWQ